MATVSTRTHEYWWLFQARPSKEEASHVLYDGRVELYEIAGLK